MEAHFHTIARLFPTIRCIKRASMQKAALTKFLCTAVLAGTLVSAADARINSLSLPIAFESGRRSNEFVSRTQSRSIHVTGDEITCLKGATAEPSTLRLIGTLSTEWTPTERLPGHSTYLLGPPSEWRTAQHYAAVRRRVYSGIDLVMHGNPAGLNTIS